MKNLVLGVNDAIYRTCVIVAATAIVIMATIIPWGVFSRYALGQGLGWPEPIAILLMVLFTFVGAAASYRAGAIMAEGGMARRLVAFAGVLVGFVRGGLSLVNITASTFFGAISGSSLADTASVGSVLIPEMEKKGYPRESPLR